MITGIVLAGGRASRLGGSKLDIRIEGGSLLDRAVAAVVEVADEVVIAGPVTPELTASAQRPGRIRFVEDQEDFPGPLAALAGALTEAEGDRAIVVAGDMPFLVAEVLAAMLAGLDDNGAAAVVLELPNAEKRQVLPVALRVGPASAAAGEALAQGDRSLVRLVDRLEGVAIPASEWQALDPDARTLVDIDEPSDLDRWRGE